MAKSIHKLSRTIPDLRASGAELVVAPGGGKIGMQIYSAGITLAAGAGSDNDITFASLGLQNMYDNKYFVLVTSAAADAEWVNDTDLNTTTTMRFDGGAAGATAYICIIGRVSNME